MATLGDITKVANNRVGRTAWSGRRYESEATSHMTWPNLLVQVSCIALVAAHLVRTQRTTGHSTEVRQEEGGIRGRRENTKPSLKGVAVRWQKTAKTETLELVAIKVFGRKEVGQEEDVARWLLWDSKRAHRPNR
eukprot:6202856-Pleurochrysis_carterae.AAC.2